MMMMVGSLVDGESCWLNLKLKKPLGEKAFIRPMTFCLELMLCVGSFWHANDSLRRYFLFKLESVSEKDLS